MEEMIKKWEETIEAKTHDELKALCKNIVLQNYQLTNALTQERDKTMLKRLDYLFRVLELDNKFSKGFVESCSKELEEALTIPESNIQEEDK